MFRNWSVVDWERSSYPEMKIFSCIMENLKFCRLKEKALITTRCEPYSIGREIQASLMNAKLLSYHEKHVYGDGRSRCFMMI